MSNLSIEHFLAVKRELIADAPPPMYAVKCNHATADYLRASFKPDPRALLWEPPMIYIDPEMPTGKVLIAQTRQMADLWRLQEWVKYEAWRRQEIERLIVVLRRRMGDLNGLMEVGA